MLKRVPRKTVLATFISVLLASVSLSQPSAQSDPANNIDGCRKDCITAARPDRPDAEKVYSISCAPHRNEPIRLFKTASLDDPIPDFWVQMINSSWSFQVERFLNIDGVQLAEGIVVDGRGRWQNILRYLVTAEWDCQIFQS